MNITHGRLPVNG